MTKMKPTILLALSSDKPSHDWEFGQKALGILYAADPALKPERLGLDDTDLRKKRSFETVEDARPFWAKFGDYVEAEDISIVDGLPDQLMSGLLWKRARPLRARGSFWFAWFHKVLQQALPSQLEITADYVERIDYEAMFKDYCALYEPQQAYLHYINKAVKNEDRALSAKINQPERLNGNIYSFLTGFFGGTKDEKTFDLGAMNFFSTDWLGEGTVERLKDAGLSVTESANGCFLDLVPNISDLDTCFETFVERRKLAKDIIGPDRFEIAA
ncbi:hypothetical protein RSK20926_09572 [Roseobacter sp. SK209-2-6]|uniref:hypothetical protein n=1 Tax=Roseobacter sp. SK209-2-6 TaxID=388739 RepID=UPI0000F3D1E8|nr:hypothetical protein [Roseobacter sp. SK209-2-6]EBA17210.1 hypothetical protein RSK20926_09572 [Roseobacter sp. SK209-2-6]